MSIRCFIALPILGDAANVLGDTSAKMAYQDKSAAVRWVDQSLFHVTLAFLGEQTETDVNRLANALDEHISQYEFSLSIDQLSPFPETKPKLIAAMVRNDDALKELHHEVMSAIRATGLQFDKRKFVPHITLGRARHSKNAYMGNMAHLAPLECWAEEVTVFESRLHSHGAEYEALHRFPLNEIHYEEYS